MKPKSIEQITSGIAPYNGVWTNAQVLHLVRRTMFGAKKSDLTYFLGRTMSQAVDDLLTVTAPSPAPPVNNYGTTGSIDPNVPVGTTWVYNTVSSSFGSARRNSLRAWWTGLQINQDRTILEKMVVFWHNHFSVQYEGVKTAMHCYNYNAMIRANALGNLKTMTREVAISPAMLYYLNGRYNTKTAPDENFARELQELFTIGKDLPAHFTEADVQAAAKILTGWRATDAAATSTFDETKHDTTNKVFSAFYNNTVINGATGATGGATELDALLTMIFANNEVANYIVRKLYRFFVYYTITPDAEQNVIQPLAAIFRQNNYNIVPVLAALLKSEHFYDTMQIACIIKSPVDFTIGYLRTFNLAFPASTDYVTQYYLWQQAWNAIAAQQAALGDPQSVAGWPPYYQAPSFHELWVTPDSLRQRKSIADGLLYTGIVKNSFTLVVDTISFVSNNVSNPSNPNVLIDEVVELLLPFSLSTTTKTSLKNILLSSQAQDHYWTDAWINYINSPSTANKTIVKQRLIGVFSSLLNLAEYQLS